MKDIYYTGSREQWYAVDVDTWGNPVYDDLYGEGKLSVLGLEDVTIHYNTTPSTHTFTYMPNGGTMDIPYVENHLAGDVITIADAPIRNGYRFKGWVDNTTTYQPGDTFIMPDQDVILVATWETIPGNYEVTYQLNGGIGDVPSECWTAGETVTIIAQAPKKDGFVFAGWSNGSIAYQPGESFTMPNHNVILSAVWKEFVGPPTPHYTVSYNLDGGAGEFPSESYPQNSKFYIPVNKPVKGQMIFSGWSDGVNIYQPGAEHPEIIEDIVLTAIWVDDPAQWPINQREVFIRQQTHNTCTLASATMMLRRRAILDNNSNWNSITESVIRRVAWGSNGLSFNFDYCGMHVSAIGIISAGYTTVPKKTEYFISLLKSHPEGIVIYNHGHAVLLTDYNAETKTFYCADPAGSLGRIPLVSCTIPGNTQDAVINSIKQIWLITSNENAKTLVSTSIITHCPIEMQITIDDMTLSSNDVNGTISNDYVDMTAQGSGQERNISAIIVGDYIFEKDISVKLIGTGTGSMTFIVKYSYSDSSEETHTFKNVPVSVASVGKAEGFYPQSTVILTLTDTSDTSKVEDWIASPNEEVSSPSQDFGMIPDSPNGPNTPNYSGRNSESNPTYSVSVPTRITGGIVKVTPTNAPVGSKVTITANPNNGYEVGSVTVNDKAGNKITVVDVGNGKYTFIMPKSKVGVNVEFVRQQTTPGFTDVQPGAYYADAVVWAVEKGITSGTSTATFSPDALCTRAQIVTFLWRAAGSPKASASSPFTDVPVDSYYYDAVLWAVKQGITNGTMFSPNATCTRAQVMAFLYRYEKSPAVSGGNVFTDIVADAYYSNAVQWAVTNGITSGTTATTFSPNSACTRAQIITFLYRDMM